MMRIDCREKEAQREMGQFSCPPPLIAAMPLSAAVMMLSRFCVLERDVCMYRSVVLTKDLLNCSGKRELGGGIKCADMTRCRM